MLYFAVPYHHHHRCCLLLGSLSSAGLAGGQRIEIHGTCLNRSSVRDNKSSCLYFSGIFTENGFCFPCFCLAYRVITADKYGQGQWTALWTVDLLLPTLARALHRAARAAISIFTLEHAEDTHGDV